MIDRYIEQIITTLFTLFLSIGIGVTFLWAAKSIKHTCDSIKCCKKKYKWICEHCGEVATSDIQPYCKPCTHIERTSKKMIRIKK